jgi:pimeloyl-ACP methyl ester carboxylesterase
LDLPLAVVLGMADSVIPAEQSREVARRAPGPVTVTEVAGADHNDEELFSGPELIGAVVALAERVNAGEP